MKLDKWTIYVKGNSIVRHIEWLPYIRDLNPSTWALNEQIRDALANSPNPLLWALAHTVYELNLNEQLVDPWGLLNDDELPLVIGNEFIVDPYAESYAELLPVSMWEQP